MEKLKYVLTGGPSVGKTSILTALEIKGYSVVREAATDIIHYEQACGNPEPWKHMQKFQDDIARLHLIRLSTVSKLPVFTDRDVLDNIVYLSRSNVAPGPIVQMVYDANLIRKDIDIVFVVEHLPDFVKNGIRRECAEEAIQLENALKEFYTTHKYNVICIKPDSVEKRVTEILTCVEIYEQKLKAA